MFSFFKSKKQSPEEPIPPANPPPAKPDDFVMVDPKPNPQPQPGMYPALGPGGMPPFGGLPSAFPPSAGSSQQSLQPYNALQGVPFKFSEQLSTSDKTEVTKIMLYDFLEVFSRNHEKENYDFSVERSVINV
ncbi:formin-1-like [Phlebotomus papatasi]|uniref:formin-1-like n=1 Tax=Phlebotomus papatasi TaxID=29031 RepID=UPI0024833FAF|nr:formin-1-like [Phlebotomus papatasi]